MANDGVGRRTFLRGASVAAGAAVLPTLEGGAAAAAAAPAGRIPDALRPGGEFERYVAGLAAEDRFAGTVLLAHGGRTVLERSYGMADRARSIPNRPGTIFSLASVTKLFTSIAIAQLVERGDLAYSDTVGAHLDGYAADVAGKVTVHHLLTHSSGLGDHMQLPGFWDEAAGWASVDEAWEGTMRYVRKATLAFAPGAGNRYSNAGFVTLGAIVAAVSGQSYYDYVRTRVFRPAGTTACDFYTLPQWRTDPRLAHPYVKEGGENVDVIGDRQTYVGGPAGGSFATAADVARVVHALRDGRLLDPVHFALASSPKLPGPSGGLSFSNYLTVGGLTRGRWSIGHGGGAPGISTSFGWFPESGWVSVVLSNYHGAANDVAAKARTLILA
jgi:CubicO group peptidase (beta-lactamase class C family)